MEDYKVRCYPDPFLRQRAAEVSEINEGIRALIEQMFKAMEDEKGIGLAAPQIGVGKRVIVISVEEKHFDRLALINPEILHLSEETDVMEEGCLSVPGVNADVRRPLEAVVRGITRSGRLVEISAKGLLARVLQHEIDHLNGTLFIDRLTGKARKGVERELAAAEKRYRDYART
jgi:peptide deformylase